MSQQNRFSRRCFLKTTGQTAGVLAATAAGGLAAVSTSLAADPQAADVIASASGPKLKIGVVGCGHRGTMLGKIFKEHGGFEIHAVADYFQEAAVRCGDVLRVESTRRFSGLSGYKRVIDSGIDAIALETPPCFFPDHATAAVDAGLHVYMAKPVAVDAPGCLRVDAAAKRATQKGRVFLIDLQMHTDPVNREVAKRFHNGGLGKIAMLSTKGVSGGHADPPKTATIESRLQKNVWDNDIAIGGGHISAFSIHSIDAGIWVVGQHPVAASASGRICRADPHGDARDAYSVIFEYADGLIHEHTGQHLPNGSTGEISCRICGQTGYAIVTYWHEAGFHARGKKPFTGEVENLYLDGAKRNVATFYQAVAAEKYDNPTVRRAIDSTLACILGREAFDRSARLTMTELLKENKRIEVDLRGLRA